MSVLSIEHPIIIIIRICGHTRIDASLGTIVWPSVTIRILITLDTHKRKTILRIKQAVTISIGVANITGTITVDIRLIRIGHFRTVVQLILNAIGIDVVIWNIKSRHCLPAGIVHTAVLRVIPAIIDKRQRLRMAALIKRRRLNQTPVVITRINRIRRQIVQPVTCTTTQVITLNHRIGKLPKLNTNMVAR